MADHDLRERFRGAADALSAPDRHVGDVVLRARQRTRRTRAAAAVGGVTATVVAIAVLTTALADRPPLTVDPVATPSTPTATATASDPVLPEATVDEPHTRYGDDGLVQHRDGTRRPLSALRVRRAVASPDGSVAVQAGPGAAIVRVTPDANEAVLVDARRWSRLLAVADGRAWFTDRSDTDHGTEDEERLWSVALDGGEPQLHGTSAGVEASTDALALLAGGRAAWLTCHLQCSLVTGPLTALGGGTGEVRELRPDAAWYAGLAADADGSRLAVVEGPDPVIGGTSDVVVLDATTGAEVARVALPVGLELADVHLGFTRDGRSVVAGDARSAFLVPADGAGPAARVAGDAGVALHAAG